MSRLIEYLNESPTVFFILKKTNKWELEYVTENVKSIYGYSAKSFIEQKVRHEDFIYKDDYQEYINQAKSVSSCTCDEFIYKPYRILNNNMVVWINHITKIIRDDEGNPSYYFGYLTDITAQKEFYRKYEETQNILDTIFKNSAHAIFLLSKDGTILKTNDKALKLFDLDEFRSNIKFYSKEFWGDEQCFIIQDEVFNLDKTKILKSYKTFINKNNKKKIYLEFTYSAIFDKKGDFLYIVCEAYDTTHLELTKKHLQEYIDIVNDNVLITRTDTYGFITYVSDAYCKFTGYEKGELLGNRHNLLRHPNNSDEMYASMWKTITSGKTWSGELQNLKKDRSEFWVENTISPDYDDYKQIVGYTSIYYDITDKKEISELLITDFLTKIYNRRHFNTVFDLELKRNRRDRKNLVLMILDIDYFKQFNDTYGHDIGDTALYEVAQALKDTLKRSYDFVFRLGGEEFGIVTSTSNAKGALILANKLKKSVEKLKIEHKENEVSPYLTISIGIKVVEPSSILDEEKIYKLADNALYEAKEKGRNQACICRHNSLI